MEPEALCCYSSAVPGFEMLECVRDFAFYQEMSSLLDYDRKADENAVLHRAGENQRASTSSLTVTQQRDNIVD